MAKLKIFLSSTYYDLKYIRRDLEQFIKQMGYEPVLNEKGNIPYGKDEELSKYCYKEVEHCDIVVSIIGGRRGSDSHDKNYSVSNLEVKKALELNKQVYIFINKEVNGEYKTYLRNKDNQINYAHVDDKKIFEFIEEITKLNKNNNIHAFETVSDILSYLQEQWSGLFQRLLSTEIREKEVNTIQQLNNTSKTLNQLVELLIRTIDGKGENLVRDILLDNHPAFQTLKSLLDIKFRIKFTNYEEMVNLLYYLGYQEIPDTHIDVPEETHYSWHRDEGPYFYRLDISKALFDNEYKLKIIQPSDWHDGWINLFKGDHTENQEFEYFDDGIPF